jgi:hypothetical protein
MKKKRILQSILVNDITWFVIWPFVYLSNRLHASRLNYNNRKEEDNNLRIAESIFSSHTVLNGLFKGLRYGNVQGTGSSVYSKLLGSYEKEISEPLTQLLRDNNYQHCINIGSDEGYYAVGVATILPDVQVFAFDCDPTARKNCTALALLNNVSNRVHVKGCFATDELPEIAHARTLFIIDCEGCENEIMTAQLINRFPISEFIIELHYKQNPLILEKLQGLFAKTHSLELINALPDHEKIMQYKFQELEGLTYKEKKYILEERDEYTQWLIARSNFVR